MYIIATKDLTVSPHLTPHSMVFGLEIHLFLLLGLLQPSAGNSRNILREVEEGAGDGRLIIEPLRAAETNSFSSRDEVEAISPR